MVGKTTQVRELIINRLDTDGERTIIDRTATKTDVLEKDLFVATLQNTILQVSNNFSNIVASQDDITRIDGILLANNLNPDTTAFDDLLADHTSNAIRLSILENLHLTNALVLSNTFSNVTTLQSNVSDIIANVYELQTNVYTNYSNISKLQSNVVSIEGNIDTVEGRVTTVENSISSISNFGDIQQLSVDVENIINKQYGTTGVIIGKDSGLGGIGSESTVVGKDSGAFLGDYSVSIGYNSTNYTSAAQTKDNTIVISAIGNSQTLTPVRSDSLYIAPIQEDDSNVIHILGSNLATHEVVTTSLLTLVDSDVHVGTTIKVFDGRGLTANVVISDDGNSSFGKNMENKGTLTVGGTSSFAGAMQINNTLTTGSTITVKNGTTTTATISKQGTSSFAGAMQVNNDATFDGIVYYKNSGTNKAQISGNDGTSSFAGAMQINNTLTTGSTIIVKSGTTTNVTISKEGTSSFAGAMQINNDLTTDGSFFVKAGSAIKAQILDDGSASFAGGVVANGITSLYSNLNVFGNTISIKSADGTTLKTVLSPSGTSSFAAAMQVNSTGTFASTLTAKDLTLDKCNIDASGHGSFNGDLTTSNIFMYNQSFVMYNGSNKQIVLRNDGTGSFGGGITVVGSIKGHNDIEIYGGSVIKFKVDSTTGNGSFGGTLQTAGATTLGSTLNVSGTGSFGGTLQAAGVTTLGSTLIVAGTGSFGTINSGGNITASSFFGNAKGTSGSFGNINSSGSVTASSFYGTTGSFGTIKSGGNVTASSFLGNAQGTIGAFGTINSTASSHTINNSGYTTVYTLTNGEMSFLAWRSTTNLAIMHGLIFVQYFAGSISPRFHVIQRVNALVNIDGTDLQLFAQYAGNHDIDLTVLRIR